MRTSLKSRRGYSAASRAAGLLAVFAAVASHCVPTDFTFSGSGDGSTGDAAAAPDAAADANANDGATTSDSASDSAVDTLLDTGGPQVYTQTGVSADACAAWTSFRSALTGQYHSITLSGSNDTKGMTCTGDAANDLCHALHSGTNGTASSCGAGWHVSTCDPGIAISSTGNPCKSCGDVPNAYILVPCDTSYPSEIDGSCTSQTINLVCAP